MDLNLQNICHKHFENLEKWTKKQNVMLQLHRIYYGNITIMNDSAKRKKNRYLFVLDQFGSNSKNGPKLEKS